MRWPIRRFLFLLLAATTALLVTSFAAVDQAGPVHKRAKTQARPALSGPALSYGTDHLVAAGFLAVNP